MSDLVAGILEDIQIQHTLDIQDELDRKKISLFGVAQKQQKFNFHDTLRENMSELGEKMLTFDRKRESIPRKNNLSDQKNVITIDRN